MKRTDKKLTKTALMVFVFFVIILVTASPLHAQEVELERPASPVRTQTVGDYLEGRLGGDRAEPAPVAEAPAAPAEVGESGGQRLHLPERKPPRADWATEGQVGESTFFDKLIRMSWSLALVCLLVWLSAKVASKAGLKGLAVGPDGSKSMIEILEKKRLSPGRTILLMRVGPKVLAVAATEKGYETLTEFSLEEFRRHDDSITESVKEATEPPREAVTTPADIARHYLSIIPGTGAKK